MDALPLLHTLKLRYLYCSPLVIIGEDKMYVFSYVWVTHLKYVRQAIARHQGELIQEFENWRPQAIVKSHELMVYPDRNYLRRS
jgi:hypothetical protein